MSADARPALSLVVLAYDDAPALPALLEEAVRALDRRSRDFEVIVVDDGSADGTARVAEAAGARDARIRVVRHPANRGVGAGFRTGADAARHEIVGYMDGDGQYDPGDLPRLLDAIAPGGADAASGRRTVRADPWPRTVISFVYNILLRLIFGLRLRDANSGIKLYRRAFLDAARPWLSDGPFYDAEILVKGTARGLRVAEVPVRHRPRRHGRAAGASPASLRRALAGIVAGFMRPYRRRSPVAALALALLGVAYRATTAGSAIRPSA